MMVKLPGIPENYVVPQAGSMAALPVIDRPQPAPKMGSRTPETYETSKGMTRHAARRYLRLIDALAEAAEDLQECEYGHPECAHVEGGACSSEAWQIAEHNNRL